MWQNIQQTWIRGITLTVTNNQCIANKMISDNDSVGSSLTYSDSIESKMHWIEYYNYRKIQLKNKNSIVL